MNWRDPELVSVFVEMVRQPNFVAHSAVLFARQRANAIWTAARPPNSR